MPRTIKTVQLEDGSDLEVYADNCNICSTEMMFPKDEADELERQFPFLRQRVEAGTPCIECARKQEQEGRFDLFSPDDIEAIKQFVVNGS